jgi:hypothetical protein
MSPDMRTGPSYSYASVAQLGRVRMPLVAEDADGDVSHRSGQAARALAERVRRTHYAGDGRG